MTTDNYITRDSGLMYEDIKVGTGDSPKDGQQVLPPKQRFYFLLLIYHLFCVPDQYNLGGRGYE